MIIVYITVGSKREARRIAGILVKEKLVACVNFFPIESTYLWDDKLITDNEFLLLCKTTKRKFKKLEQKVKGVHSYELPVIIALPIISGNLEFLTWVKRCTK